MSVSSYQSIRGNRFKANFLAAALQSPSNSTFLTSEFFPAAPSPSANYPQDDSNTPILIGCLVTIILLLVIIIFLILWCQYVCKVLEKVSTNRTNLNKKYSKVIILFHSLWFLFGINSTNWKSDFTVTRRSFSPALFPFSENPGTPLEAFLFTVWSCSQ